MAVLDRRVHLLLDPAQYEQVEREARQRGGSVGSVIRNAIDDALGRSAERRAAAAARLLAWEPDAEATGEDWEAAKQAMEADLSSRVG